MASTAEPAQTNFNGGEISRRLHARQDLNLYNIALAACTGWAPLPEGGLEACPGTIRVAAAKGACRLLPFEFSTTQAYVIEVSAGAARFYTNDVRIEAAGVPVELALPYDKTTIDALTYEQSYDVMYLFHRAYQTRLLSRTGADAFTLDLMVLKNGPFETRNDDESLVVSASGVSGAVSLTASQPIFAAGDVGGLFQLEADDFGDIASWEPGITVTNGQLLVWNERVYRVAGGSGRTGTVAPIHGEGVEWDGIGQGKDINDKNAGGVQLEYLCDRFGTLRITAFTSAAHVSATVLRRLPFTASSSYTYTGGYSDPDWDGYTPPGGAVTYAYGTWRWRFGAFSDRRGWPSCGVIWNERLVLAKDATLYGGVAGDLYNHATRNEEGDISADMAFQATLADPNAIVGLVADERLLVLTPSGMFTLGPSNQAQGVGPNNLAVARESNEGAAAIRPVQIDGRTVYVGKSRRRMIQAEYAVQRDRQDAIDLTRYARQIGGPRFVALAAQKDPNRLLWACRADGTLALACHVPEEQVLGWGNRTLGGGALARSIAPCRDPDGELDQLWIAAQTGEQWHVLRMAQFRQEGDAADPAMVDMAGEHDVGDGGATTTLGPFTWLAGSQVDVQTDPDQAGNAVYLAATCAPDGIVTITEPAERAYVGRRFPAAFTTLPAAATGDTGGAIGRMRRVSQLTLAVLDTRGLSVSVQGAPARPIEELTTDSVLDQGFAPYSGVVIAEDCGRDDRYGAITIAREAPTAATVRAVKSRVTLQ